MLISNNDRAPLKIIFRQCVRPFALTFSYKNLEIKATKEKSVFADDSKIGSWAVDAVYTCQMAEIVGGKGNNMFDPKATGSRAEAATIFTRFHKNYIA